MEAGNLHLFESGACLLHLAEAIKTSMQRDKRGPADARRWVIAAFDAIGMVSDPPWFLGMSGARGNRLFDWLDGRLAALERVLGEWVWLAAARFTAADIAMADVLRIPNLRATGDRPATEAYVARATGRPGFEKAHADRNAPSVKADAVRRQSGR